MNSFNLNFIIASCIVTFFGIGVLKSPPFLPNLSLKSSHHLVLSDSSKSDSSKKDSTNLPQLIEVGNTKSQVIETELKPQNELETFAKDSIFLITDKPVEYIEGNMDLFYKFIASNINYPIEARKKKQQEKVYVRFVINKNGSVSKAESVRGEHELLKQEAERVVSLTKWIPAQIKGQNVHSLMTIPITFKLETPQPKKQILDEVPVFEGGLDELYSYISQNLKYPKSAKRSGAQGRVIIAFNIEKDGNFSDFEIIQSVSPDCDAEAIRVLKQTAPWIPAQQNGKAVKTRISMPIVFKLDN
ncbi:TonB family protein [Bernardetia litoralis DSM 6794]|uniref:TonB family protein n=1 Tax=Bernardetia litoralis (strain ATCC 23117 / DSM 6794 / NBRC 15988 / NCIMB 1366 / Fx l1 / Sio-4) TaxID=880071 RepID=I4AGK8_BERLS|nr:energy transducer TonB [Bernardetia litoralis]AFM03093.1 TonB family protein [Bernardetia litoralis DSM 6794]